MFVPLVLVTATLIIAVVAMPTMVNHVAATHYPTLERRRGGTFAGSVWNAVVALVVFLVFSLLLLPLWFVPLFWPVLPVLLFAYFNQRVFRYDALADHASAEEMRGLFRQHGMSLYLLGIVLSLLAHIPVIGFFIPVVAGLAFIHYLLERVADLRRSPVVGAWWWRGEHGVRRDHHRRRDPAREARGQAFHEAHRDPRDARAEARLGGAPRRRPGADHRDAVAHVRGERCGVLVRWHRRDAGRPHPPV